MIENPNCSEMSLRDSTAKLEQLRLLPDVLRVLQLPRKTMRTLKMKCQESSAGCLGRVTVSIRQPRIPMWTNLRHTSTPLPRTNVPYNPQYI